MTFPLIVPPYNPPTQSDDFLTEGYTAGKTGSDFLACPYELGSIPAIKWMQGHSVWQMEFEHLHAPMLAAIHGSDNE